MKECPSSCPPREESNTVDIRPCRDADIRGLIELTIETFRPFYEEYVRPLLGDELFRHQHGRWEQDYADEVPALLDPSTGRHVAVAEVDRAIVGYVAWRPGERPRSGEIQMLAVSSAYRHRAVGRGLCLHAIGEMKASGVDVVGIATGDDAFHASARALYESLGFIKIPIAGYLKRV